MTHPGVAHQELTDGQRISVTGTEIAALRTPGYLRDATRLHLLEAGEPLTEDTPFAGGPGATGRSYSDFPTIIGSIRDRLFALPADPYPRTEGRSIRARCARGPGSRSG